MKNTSLLAQLTEKNIISAEQATQIETHESTQPFSIHWELRFLLYLGITLLSTGVGTVIYQNIDTIGHGVLVSLVALVCAGCFGYAFWHKKPFSWSEHPETSNLEDFALLGGCITFLSLEGYLQYQYNIFGTRYGLVAFLPAVLFFFCAYYFDHRGVLSMAITALASWVGVNITPLKLLENNDFNGKNLAITAILLGIFLVVVGWLTAQKDWKKHFTFTYFILGGNLALVAASFALFNFDLKVIYAVIIAILCYSSITYARREHSYLFMLMGVIYGYVAFTYCFFEILPQNIDPMMPMLYFMLSAAGVIAFLVNLKQIIGLKK